MAERFRTHLQGRTKKSETELTASVLKKDLKHTRVQKNAFYLEETGQNVQIFEEILFFSGYVQHKNRKTNNEFNM